MELVFIMERVSRVYTYYQIVRLEPTRPIEMKLIRMTIPMQVNIENFRIVRFLYVWSILSII